MRKYLLAVTLLLITAFQVFPQTTVTIESVSANAGESISVPINVVNFNDVSAISFKINYDPNILTFTGVANAPVSINATAVGGVLTLGWFDATASSPINIANGKLLDLQFDYAGGNQTNLSFDVAQCEVANSLGNPLNVTYVNGVVSQFSLVVGLEIGSLDNPVVGPISVPLNVTGFSNVGAVSIKIAYNSNTLTFSGISGAPNGDFAANASNGVVSISWFDLSGTSPLTVADGLLLTVDFTYNGGFSTLNFVQAQTEIADADGNPFTLEFQNGFVGSTANVELETVASQVTNTSVLVPLNAYNFVDVGAISLKIQYNQAVLTYVGVSNTYNGISISANAQLGVLTLSWFQIPGDPVDGTPLDIVSDKLADIEFTYASGASNLTFNEAQCEIANSNGVPLQVTYTNGRVYFNQPPVFDPIADIVVNVGDLVSFTLVVANPDGDNLLFDVQGLPAGADFDEDNLSFTWTPDADGFGEHAITFSVDDQNGGTDVLVVNITVNDVFVYDFAEYADGGNFDLKWVFNQGGAAPSSIRVADSSGSAWGSHVVIFTDSGYTGLTHPRELALTNYTVSADIYLVADPDPAFPLYTGLGIKMSHSAFQYYRVVFRNSTSSNHGEIRLQGYDGASWHISKYWVPGVDFTALTNGWHNFKVRVNGNKFWCYIDDVLLPGGPYEDSAPFGLSAGYPGIFVYNATPGSVVFDNFIVEATEVPAQPEVAISAIQGQAAASPYKDIFVNATGIVTGKTNNGFFLQSEAGAWNGVWVYGPAQAALVTVGDNVTVLGYVDEYFELTEILGLRDMVINSSGNEIPAATWITTGELGEAYEGVLISVLDAECTDDDLGFGEWQIDDGSGPAVVDDLLFAYDPTLGNRYTVTGIITFSFGAYKIEPRSAGDVVKTFGPEALTSLDHTPGDLAITVYNNGRIGDQPGLGGRGIEWKGQNGLWRSALVFGRESIGVVSGAAHQNSISFADLVSLNANFAGGFLSIDVFDQVSYALISDDNSANPYGLPIIQFTSSRDGEETVIFSYGFINNTSETIDDLFAGLFIDFDVDGATYTTNSGGYSDGEYLVYVYDATSPYYYGVCALNGWSGYNVTKTNLDDLTAFRQAAFGYITTPDADDADKNGDQRAWIGSKVNVYDDSWNASPIAPGDTGWVSFAIVAGDQLIDIRTNADNAFELARVAGFTPLKTDINDGENGIPTTYSLSQNYPNPFNPSTTIQYGLPFASQVKIKVYNLLGEVVDILVDTEKAAGYHKVNWNASNLASGVYFYTIEASSVDSQKDFSVVKKMMFIK